MAVFLRKNSTSSRNKRAPMSEMNVTPMIDVMLVLLVIFMVTAPMLTVGVKVNLPSSHAPVITEKETPIIVFIDSKGIIYIGDIEIDLQTLPDKLQAITSEQKMESKIFVKGDKNISYGDVMRVMGRISSAGFKKVVLITELPKPADTVITQNKRKSR